MNHLSVTSIRLPPTPKQGSGTKSTELSYLVPFLQALCSSGSVVSAMDKIQGLAISPMEMKNLIIRDKALKKSVELAHTMAYWLAESTLYERVVNGDYEITYDKDGHYVSATKKFSTELLFEYLRMYSPKYRNAEIRTEAYF